MANRSRRRHRRLQEEGTSVPDEEETPIDKMIGNKIEAAKETDDFRDDVKMRKEAARKADNDALVDAFDHYDDWLEKKSKLLLEVAELNQAKAYEAEQREKLLSSGGTANAIMLELAAVMDDKEYYKELLDMKKKEEELVKRQAEQDEKIRKKNVENLLKYEKVWMKAIDKVGVTENEMKAVGKVENALNKVVKWFSNKYGCEMGITVDRLA